ncbi:hypothetical protein CWD92_30990 [Burkholderia thailandensis]|nr:hypothetical protein CWD92_30990 [Burkholderia thailandensis]
MVDEISLGAAGAVSSLYRVRRAVNVRAARALPPDIGGRAARASRKVRVSQGARQRIAGRRDRNARMRRRAVRVARKQASGDARRRA